MIIIPGHLFTRSIVNMIRTVIKPQSGKEDRRELYEFKIFCAVMESYVGRPPH